MYDSCYAWVADGTSERVHCTDGPLDDTFEIHMNWGWNGNNDRNYKIKSRSNDYEYDKTMIYNLHPQEIVD